MGRVRPIIPLSFVACLLATGAARAESLAEALALAYESNPKLQMQRAQLRAQDESYVQARAALGPSVQLQVSATYDQTKLSKSAQRTQRLTLPNPPDEIERNSASANITVSQTLYSGGRISAQVFEAEAAIWAGREALRATEGNVLLSVIQTYAAVRRDQAQLDIRGKNLEMLQAQLKETQARLRAGEVTRTDVAQAEAQLAAERALYAAAQGQLLLSRTAYFEVVGRNPGTLEPEPPLPGLPATVDEAFDIAEHASPDLNQARRSEQQSRARVVEARAEAGATVSLRGQYGHTGPALPYDRRNMDREVVAEAVVSKPLFSSGIIQSGVRQSLQLNTSDRVRMEAIRREVIRAVADAWNQILTARAAGEAQEAQRKAAELAFRGMRVEYRAGERSTLDVLVAEQTLRDAELALIAARHDQYVATAALLRQLGRLEARALIPAIPTYSPADNFRKVEQAGAVPWIGMVDALDRLGKPPAAQTAIMAPAVPAKLPEIAPTKNGGPNSATSATSLPITPEPGAIARRHAD